MQKYTYILTNTLKTNQTVTIQLFNITEIFLGLGLSCLKELDLLTINCEGCEFEVLEELLKTNIILLSKPFLIQCTILMQKYTYILTNHFLLHDSQINLYWYEITCVLDNSIWILQYLSVEFFNRGKFVQGCSIRNFKTWLEIMISYVLSRQKLTTWMLLIFLVLSSY
jgi:hypothetical protein